MEIRISHLNFKNVYNCSNMGVEVNIINTKLVWYDPNITTPIYGRLILVFCEKFEDPSLRFRLINSNFWEDIDLTRYAYIEDPE